MVRRGGLVIALVLTLTLGVAGSALAAPGHGDLTIGGSLDVDGQLRSAPARGALFLVTDAADGGTITLDLHAFHVNVTRVVLKDDGPELTRVSTVEREYADFTRATLSTGAPHAATTRVLVASDAFQPDATTVTLQDPTVSGVTQFTGIKGARGGEADMRHEDPAVDFKFIAEETFLSRTTAPVAAAVQSDALVLYVYGADLTVTTESGSRTFETGTRETGPDTAPASTGRERSFVVVRAEGVTGAVASNGVDAHWFQPDLAPHVTGGITASAASGNVRVEGRDHPADAEAVTVQGELDLVFARTGSGESRVASTGPTFDPGFRVALSGDVHYVSIAAASSVYPAAAAAVGVAGLLAVLVFWQHVKFWGTVALLPLYTRLKEPEILNNAARHQIYEIIRSNPGLSARAIHRAADQSWGTVVYHLRQLERHHLVTSRRVGRSRNFYENHGKYRGMEVELATLKSPRALLLAERVLHEPGITQERLTEQSGLPQPTTSYYVRKLKDAGILQEERSGRYAHYFPCEDLERLIRLARAESAPPEATDGQAASTA